MMESLYNWIFKIRYTNWTPFFCYTISGKGYMVIARRNLGSGMFQFKTKKIHSLSQCQINLTKLNPNEALEKINRNFELEIE